MLTYGFTESMTLINLCVLTLKDVEGEILSGSKNQHKQKPPSNRGNLHLRKRATQEH